jgi:hypothetical protein
MDKYRFAVGPWLGRAGESDGACFRMRAPELRNYARMPNFSMRRYSACRDKPSSMAA